MSEKKMVKGIIISLLVFLLFGFSIKSGLAFEQKTYSLQIALDASCIPISFLNYQSIEPVVVSFQLKNLGNETFNGAVTLRASTDKHSYDAITFNVTNLATNETNSNSTSYSTTDEGNYYFTLEIESNDFSNIKLYQDSNLLNQNPVVSTRASVFLHSFTEFIEIMAIVVTIMLAIVGAIVGLAIHRKRKRL